MKFPLLFLMLFSVSYLFAQKVETRDGITYRGGIVQYKTRTELKVNYGNIYNREEVDSWEPYYGFEVGWSFFWGDYKHPYTALFYRWHGEPNMSGQNELGIRLMIPFVDLILEKERAVWIGPFMEFTFSDGLSEGWAGLNYIPGIEATFQANKYIALSFNASKNLYLFEVDGPFNGNWQINLSGSVDIGKLKWK